MHHRSPSLFALSLLGTVLTGSLWAEDTKAKKVTYAEDVAPIFRNRCNSCHNADKQKGGLTLDNFGAAMQGGSSGKVVEPGDPDSSTLLNLVAHTEQPYMPPMAPKIPDAEIAIIRQWIEAGAPETTGSVVAMKAKPKFEFKLDPSMMGKPQGPPAIPVGISTEPVVVSLRPNAITAMAASPWAPLIAVSGHKQVLIYDSEKKRLTAVFPFPEGTIHSLKFSRNGSLLVAAGGRGGQSGIVIVFDVKNGKRVFEIGKEKEYDVVLAADISPDQGQVALGGPGKVLRVYSTTDGSLQFEMKKHTEWVTAVEFSPDGVLLASGDRNSGLYVWEAQTGREFFELRNHTLAITDVAWRLDSNVLASTSEDGTIRLWEMENGGNIKGWGAHGGGTESVRFAKDGRLLSTGRDRIVRLWDQNGGKLRDFEALADLGLRAVFTHDDASVASGDWAGQIRINRAADGVRLVELAANPAPVVARLEKAGNDLKTAEAAAVAATQALVPVVADATAKGALAATAQAEFDAANNAANAKAGEIVAFEKGLADKTAAEVAATAAVAAAQAISNTAMAELAEAEKQIPLKIAAEKASFDSMNASKAAVMKALVDKTALDANLVAAVEGMKNAKNKAEADAASLMLSQVTIQVVSLTANLATSGQSQAGTQGAYEIAVLANTNAPKLVEAAKVKANALGEAVKPLAAALAVLTAEKGVLAKNVADAKAAQPPLVAAVAAKKAQIDGAMAAKTAADKALADGKLPVDLLVMKVNDLKNDTEALSAELKSREAAKPTVATGAEVSPAPTQ